MPISALSSPQFHSEESAFAFLESVVWSGGKTCPHCGGIDRITKVRANPDKRIRIGLWRCGDCKKQFTVKVGTVFEHMRLPLHKALQAAYLISSSKKGISAHQLHRTLGITYKSAWFLAHRIREAMKDDGSIMGGPGVAIEADETYIGQQPYQFRNGEGWSKVRSGSEMNKVLTLVERGGRARSLVIDNLRIPEILRALESASRDSNLNTDEARHYRRVGREFASHGAVDHSKHQFGFQGATTNTVEGFFSIFKRGMRGVYQHCSPRHLQRYLVEFDFRYSNREALGVNDRGRCLRALGGIVGKRLMYRQASAA